MLFGVDFHVGRGEMVALLGTNGAGKSTLLVRDLRAGRPPVPGSITFDGEDITGARPSAPWPPAWS